MSKKITCGICIFMIASMVFFSPFVSVDTNTLLKSDFQQTNFQKTVDYFDYVRAYATLNGISTPENFDRWHAYMYMTYVNTSGIQLLYSGLENITTDGSTYLRIPGQSTLMHYKANGISQDVITASTFLMLMAFNDTSTSRYQDSPDVGDNLYASYSLGFDYSSIGASMPALNSQTQTIPLTSSSDGLQWSWGMKYTNLTALWWKTWIDPNNAHFDNSLPFAITTYDELSFKYSLTIDQTNNKATLSENHVIGRMRDMLIGSGLFWFHLNSTGTYGLLGRRLSDQTIYSFLDKNQIKMSVVDYQTTIMANHTTYSTTANGQKLTQDEIVSDSAIDTYTDSGNKIGSLDFAAKSTYNLYNFTADQLESAAQNYKAVTRTADAAGFAGNGGLFSVQINLMKFLPLVVIPMYPGLYQKTAETVSDMSRANYFYITSYPTYSGYRIEHDPVFTAYIASTEAPNATTNAAPSNHPGIFLLIGVIVVIIAVVTAVVLIKRKKPRTPS
jgi:hypothetical protein